MQNNKSFEKTMTAAAPIFMALSEQITKALEEVSKAAMDYLESVGPMVEEWQRNKAAWEEENGFGPMAQRGRANGDTGPRHASRDNPNEGRVDSDDSEGDDSSLQEDSAGVE